MDREATRGADHRRDTLFSYVRPDSRIPKNHPLRAIRCLADEALQALDGDFAELYSENGRPSILRWTPLAGSPALQRGAWISGVHATTPIPVWAQIMRT